jgi:hypothetical protein
MTGISEFQQNPESSSGFLGGGETHTQRVGLSVKRATDLPTPISFLSTSITYHPLLRGSGSEVA